MKDLIRKFIRHGIVFPPTQDVGMSALRAGKITPTAYTTTLEGLAKNQREVLRTTVYLTQFPLTTRDVTFRNIQLLNVIFSGSQKVMQLLDGVYDQASILLKKEIEDGLKFRVTPISK